MKSLILVFVAFGIISFLSYFAESFLGYYNTPNVLSSGIVIYLIFFLIHRSGNSLLQIDRMQLFLLLSFVCWFSAEAMYGYYSGVLKIDPYPSIANIFYFAGYIFFILLLWSLNKTYKIELSIIISLLITFFLFAFYVLYISVFIFNVYSFSGSIIDLMLVFAYPIFDLFIIIGGVVYYFREREISLTREYVSWLLISACGFFFFIADVIFGLNDLSGFTEDDHLYDLFFNVGYLILGIALMTRIFYLDIHRRNE